MLWMLCEGGIVVVVDVSIMGFEDMVVKVGLLVECFMIVMMNIVDEVFVIVGVVEVVVIFGGLDVLVNVVGILCFLYICEMIFE